MTTPPFTIIKLRPVKIVLTNANEDYNALVEEAEAFEAALRLWLANAPLGDAWQIDVITED